MSFSVLAPLRATTGVKATVVSGLAAGALLGCVSEQPGELEGESVDTESSVRVTTTEPVVTTADTQATTVPPDTQPAEVELETSPAVSDVPDEAIDEAVGQFTLADAAAADDPRIGDIECEYLTGQQEDELARVLEFRADRDRFFDIETTDVLQARTEGLTFTEIAADHGYTAAEVQAGAAAMHGFCFQQLIGPDVSEQEAERRFQTTMLRFAERADAEPVGNGDGRPADGGIDR